MDKRQTTISYHGCSNMPLVTKQGMVFTHQNNKYPPRVVAFINGYTLELLQEDVIAMQNLFAEYRIGEKSK